MHSFIFFILLQSAEVDWLKTALNVGGFGVVCWLVYYVFKTMLPSLIVDFKEQLQEQRESFERMINAQRRDNQNELRAQRQEFRQELANQRQDFQDELQRERSAVEKLLSVFRER